MKALKKNSTTTKPGHIKEQFILRIRNKAADGNYTEIVVLFDEWRKESLKDKTRAKRAEGEDEAPKGFDMHDDMSLKKTSLAELLATNECKMVAYLAEGLTKEYKGNTYVKLVVTYSSKVCINESYSLDDKFQSHGHEEAGTQIPLHVLCVLCDSTDVLILLIDLVSRGNIGALTNIILHTGKYNSPKDIDVVQRVSSLGKNKSHGRYWVPQFHRK